MSKGFSVCEFGGEKIIEMRATNNNFVKDRASEGSAFILAVVLMSLLAIVGAMFIMVSRLDRMSASAISDNKQLDYAVETIVAKIADELAMDIPQLDPNGLTIQEYYDYPDILNRWLANLEPNESKKWRHISDVYNVYDILDVNVWNLPAEIVVDYQMNVVANMPADVDGDGVTDSRWIMLPDVTNSKGKPIFAAIRVIDNGGMLNVNTGYEFDPNEILPNRIDGSSQMQINLTALSQRGVNSNAADKLQLWRSGNDPNKMPLTSYEPNVIWQYGNPIGGYTPFDISDEFKLRNRFILNYNKITTRIEDLWANAYDGGPEMPIPTNAYPLDRWFDCTRFDLASPNDYEYRHISTTYNMDRIIDPNGHRMVNVNRGIAAELYSAIYSGFHDVNFTGQYASAKAAQIAANIIDWRDDNSDVNTVYDGYGTPHYGFEQPCVYISELAHKFVPDPNDPNIVYKSYAIELYKPYLEDNVNVGWRVGIDGISIDIGTWPQEEEFYVILNQDAGAILAVDANTYPAEDSNLVFTDGSQIRLQRPVADVNDYIVVDSKQVPVPIGGWLAEDGNDHSVQRDINLHRCIRRLWSDPLDGSTLGGHNNFVYSDSNMIQAHPANGPFISIGDIGMVLARSAYSEDPNSAIWPDDNEGGVRVDLSKADYQQVLNYLTVIDPNNYGHDLSETRVKGRININTAPWYVIAQLPWVSQRGDGYNSWELARAIVEHREGVGAFRSIGELNNVAGMDYYSSIDANDQGFPDLTDLSGYEPGDGAANDFEERDLIFARISNLVTVRSDVYTAYILVRIGTNGPQKRAIAILDRSGVISPDDKVKIIALQEVPDPR